ncbi:13541_t:CDS:2 [Gigaspora margarita]|uniref:13541_t:CDS:1 n=1 Tax=Gigaspora margarita TaxID=4874 RepID=A0ABM8W000_GIGMA|nr:13541_t:CDS:2 [Gigaspora margarita]
MVKKQGGKIACGQCHQFFKEDDLILDEQNNRYLCEGCYEPRDQDPEREKCQHCGEYVEECECDKDDINNGDDDDIEYESPRMERGTARIKREESRIIRNARARPTEKEKSKYRGVGFSLNIARDWLNIGLKKDDYDFAYWLELNGYSPEKKYKKFVKKQPKSKQPKVQPEKPRDPHNCETCNKNQFYSFKDWQQLHGERKRDLREP